MIKRFVLPVSITVILLAASSQAGLQQARSVVKPLEIELESDSRLTWAQAVNAFSGILSESFSLKPDLARQFSEWILDASQVHQVPADLMAALINTESHFRLQAVSWADAVGPAQVIPRWWNKVCEADLRDPEHNIYCGALVLRRYYNRYCGAESWRCALEYYHTGPGKMALGNAYAQTRLAYVTKVNRSLAKLGNRNGYDLNQPYQPGRG